MTYSDLIKRLFNVNLHSGVKLGLDNCKQLQYLLNVPERHYQTIHVAGTNGKGSVTTKIAAALQANGYRVGLYTSPHISCFRERIRVNGTMIPEKDIETILPLIFKITQKENIPATFFELTTFLAFLYFKQEQVDIAVIETGLGGRLDATNILNPLLSVITSISLDHTDILGNTLEEIAKEKAGIIKPKTPVVIGPKVPYSVIQEITKQLDCPLIQTPLAFSTFEEENRAIAYDALRQLAGPLKLTSQAIDEGLTANQPCRFEVLSAPCTTILDVAHNPDGLEHLFEAIRIKFGCRSLRIIFGLSKNKDIQGCLEVLKKYGHDFHIVEAPNGRGATTQSLSSELLRLEISPQHIFISEDITTTLQVASQEASKANQILVVCGSFFIMGEIRKALKLQDSQDEFDLNEIHLNPKPFLNL